MLRRVIPEYKKNIEQKQVAKMYPLIILPNNNIITSIYINYCHEIILVKHNNKI
jgi:hypothetical protein